MNKSARIANRQAWIERLKRFAQANQTVAQFCQIEGVSVPSFYNWRKKIRPENDSLTIPPTFLPVELAATPKAQPATVLSLDLPGGVSLRLEVRCDQEQAS